MRRRSAGARAGNALAARGQLAGSSRERLGALGAIWLCGALDQEITRVL